MIAQLVESIQNIAIYISRTYCTDAFQHRSMNDLDPDRLAIETLCYLNLIALYRAYCAADVRYLERERDRRNECAKMKREYVLIIRIFS